MTLTGVFLSTQWTGRLVSVPSFSETIGPISKIEAAMFDSPKKYVERLGLAIWETNKIQLVNLLRHGSSPSKQSKLLTPRLAWDVGCNKVPYLPKFYLL